MVVGSNVRVLGETMKSVCIALLAAIAVALATHPAAAAEAKSDAKPKPTVKSVVKPIVLKKCKKGRKVEDGASWKCPGPKGYEVHLAEGDLRQFVSYGSKADEQAAAGQTLAAFNSIFKNDGDKAEVIWRMAKVKGKWAPIATIVRYFTSSDAGTTKQPHGEVLVVTKLGAPNSAEACQVAKIDALANTDADALALLVAGGFARSFKCGTDPKVIGNTGISPM